MNCNTCNYKTSHFMSAIRELKPGATYLFFFNDEEYTYDDIMIFEKIINENSESGMIFMPASMIKGIKEETCN